MFSKQSDEYLEQIHTCPYIFENIRRPLGTRGHQACELLWAQCCPLWFLLNWVFSLGSGFSLWGGRGCKPICDSSQFLMSRKKTTFTIICVHPEFHQKTRFRNICFRKTNFFPQFCTKIPAGILTFRHGSVSMGPTPSTFQRFAEIGRFFFCPSAGFGQNKNNGCIHVSEFSRNLIIR